MISPISGYSGYIPINQIKNSKKQLPSFTAAKKLSMEELKEISDLKVFSHHIYEFKKGIRSLVLTTEKSKYKDKIAKRLERENIDYVIHDVNETKINVYFGEKPCVDVIKTFNPELSKTSPEQDFILGILLGYDKVKQCIRYMGMKAKEGLKKN